ncbi:unnamed protein product [Adineta steineri]|uniref:ADP ribosyltransferase domain-containing protein n=1 Tax=Adineta steineri TaxID=433720 RepID=A0A815E075_9BILA|nr:unnamed protein product [Adineta steineri]CAF1303523.1 unnamed protein product [Adineta steineri]CAF1304585.1 unnamed protein product [Adineta steineri]
MASNVIQNSSTNNQDNQTCYYHIIWLDKYLKNFSNTLKLKQLSQFDSKIKSFICENECIEYIREQNTNTHIIFIISGSLSEQIIPKIQDYNCILTILIFCTDIDRYNHLKFKKLQAICDDTYDLMDSIEIYMTKNNDREIHFSLLNQQESADSESTLIKTQHPIRNLKEDQARFLWFYHCHNFMIELKNNDNERAKKEMIAHCRRESQDERTLSRIDDFERESLEENAKHAIEWYTKNSFIFRSINTVFRREKISNVYNFRYMIKLLCQQLKDQHKKFIGNSKESKSKSKNSICLYRGQQLQLKDINLLKDHENDLISMNGFVSTTLDKHIALKFAFQYERQDFEHVLFKIDVDINDEFNVIFADIRDLSKYPEEEEILFSIGTIFRIKSVKFNNEKQLYIVCLKLTHRNELDAIKYIEQTYLNDMNSSDQSVLFGKLLFDIGEYEFAIKYFTDTLNHLVNNDHNLRATYLNNLGVCYNELENAEEALKCYQDACIIYRDTNNHHGLGTCHHNIASIYHAIGRYNDACGEALEALDYRKENNLQKASTLDLLGCIYLKRNDPDAAEDYFKKALKIRLKYLNQINPNHPDIGISYQNLGGLYKKAFPRKNPHAYYSKAAEIFRHNYPKSHPLVKNINKYLRETEQLP